MEVFPFLYSSKNPICALFKASRAHPSHVRSPLLRKDNPHTLLFLYIYILYIHCFFIIIIIIMCVCERERKRERERGNHCTTNISKPSLQYSKLLNYITFFFPSFWSFFLDFFKKETLRFTTAVFFFPFQSWIFMSWN